MRVLAITQLFPNAQEPLFSPFNRQQLAALSRLCELHVVAPVPWFPGARRLAATTRAGRLATLARSGRVDGLEVRHPRFVHLPKIGHWVSGPVYAASLWPVAREYRGRIDVVLGAWAYPDGWAAVALAKLLGVPAVIKLHGSDMNVVAKLTGPRLWLRAILPNAARVVAVSRRLGETAAALGVPAERIELVFNGVDDALFSPRERTHARRELGVDPQSRLILFVGALLESKGVGELVAAFERVAPAHPELAVAFVGDGPLRERCAALAARFPGRVHVAGAVALPQVATWLGACQVLALPSWNEGTPNVVLEALSSGRRVVATDVGGIPDLITSELMGELVPPRRVDALAAALTRAALLDYDPDAVRQAGGRGDWAQSARELHGVLARAAKTPLHSQEHHRGRPTAKSA